MIARSIVAALLLLGLSGRVAQVRGQGSESKPAPAAATSGARNPAPRAEDRTRRVRELIYFFRTYRVFCRDEEWAQTIREIATIGKDAVPELIAELDRTDRDATIRSLAFCLRAIGDPRAVPALIRAIPKALRPPGSDCGVGIADPDLRRFMKEHQNCRDADDDSVAVGRPVNEILSALERITKHREPPQVGDNDPLRGVFLGGNPEQQARQRAQFEERRKLWEAWWSGHRGEFVTPEELRTVELPRREEDLVEQAGVARYGVLFPTGAGVRLGPVRMLRLTRSLFMNAKSHLDLDTGRVFCQYEGYRPADWGDPQTLGVRRTGWYRKNGIDVRCQGPADSIDLMLWLVDDSRWDTIEDEIRRGEPLPLGREATSLLVRFGESRTDFRDDELATFLFTTREGGRGILQVFPKDQDTDRYRLRYRMWSNPTAAPAADARAAAGPRGSRSPGKTPFGKVVAATLERPAEGRPCLLDLETGRTAMPPEIVKPEEIANARSLPQNERFARWCRDQGIDVFAYVATLRARAAAAAPARVEVGGPKSRWTLIGLDMVEARVTPEAFDEMTVEEAREILGWTPEGRLRLARMTPDARLAERPDTFTFRTREGAVGLLQIEAAGDEPPTLRVRYRLERRD